MEDQLIALVRESVFLYSKTDKRYKNTYLREKKWMEISVILGVEGKHFQNPDKCIVAFFLSKMKGNSKNFKISKVSST